VVRRRHSRPLPAWLTRAAGSRTSPANTARLMPPCGTCPREFVANLPCSFDITAEGRIGNHPR